MLFNSSTACRLTYSTWTVSFRSQSYHLPRLFTGFSETNNRLVKLIFLLIKKTYTGHDQQCMFFIQGKVMCFYCLVSCYKKRRYKKRIYIYTWPFPEWKHTQLIRAHTQSQSHMSMIYSTEAPVCLRFIKFHWSTTFNSQGLHLLHCSEWDPLTSAFNIII